MNRVIQGAPKRPTRTKHHHCVRCSKVFVEHLGEMCAKCDRHLASVNSNTMEMADKLVAAGCGRKGAVKTAVSAQWWKFRERQG